MAAVSYGVSALARKPKKQESSSHMTPSSTIDAPTAEEGIPIPVLFGTKRIKGPNVVWYGDITTEAIEK